jgi:hypothetical protein
MCRQHLDRLQVKRCATECDAALSTAPGQLRDKRFGQFPVSALAVDFTVGEDFRSKQFVNAKQLKLYPPAPYIGRTIDKLKASLQIAVMVARNLGNK